MSSPKIPFTVTYKKAGTTPPLFLAGSFSDPEWEPKEMEYTTDEDGEHTFTSEVMVETDKEYQFKLRVGQGEWWVLSEDHETATDVSGNKNNVLTVPNSSVSEHADGNAANNDASTNDVSTNNATSKEEPKSSMPTTEAQIPRLDEPKDELDDLKTPLFAHECLGAYTFADDESEEEEGYQSLPMRRYVESKSTEYNESDVDLNDPTIEKFPSDRGSIIDALRTIQTHLSEDQTHLKDIPASPRVVSGKPASIDSTSADEMILSPVALSPNTTRRREQRLSHSSFGRSRSAVSLGSIAEEDPKAPESVEDDLSPSQLSPINKGQDPPPVVTLPNPNTVSADEERRSPPSEEDEAVAMKNPKAASNGKAGKMTPTRSLDDALVPDELSQELEVSVSDVSENDDEVELQQRVDQSKAPLEPSNLYEAGSLASDTTHAATTMTVRATKEDAKLPRSEASKRHATVGKWLRVLLTRVRHNKLRMILATGAVVVAMGIRWWTGVAN